MLYYSKCLTCIIILLYWLFKQQCKGADERLSWWTCKHHFSIVQTKKRSTQSWNYSPEVLLWSHGQSEPRQSSSLPVFLDSTLFCFSNMAGKRQWALQRGTQNSTSKRSSEQGRTCLAFDDVASEVTECNVCFNLSVTAVTGLLICGRGGRVSKNL